MESEFAPIFVVGCPRSGTTILASYLNRHRDIAIAPETYFFHRERRKWGSKRLVTHVRLMNECIPETPMENLVSNPDRLVSRFDHYEPTYANLFRATLEEFMESQNKTRPGERTSTHVEFIDKILEWYPKAKFVLAVRDGRDVVNQLMAEPLFHSRLRRHCHSWRRLVKIGRQAEEQHGPQVVHRVCFDQLIHHPESTLRSLINFLEAEFDSKMIEGDLELPEPELFRVGIWNKSLSPRQVAVVDSVMKETLEELKYAPTYPPGKKPGWFSRMRNWIFNLPLSIAYEPSVYRTVRRVI